MAASVACRTFASPLRSIAVGTAAFDAVRSCFTGEPYFLSDLTDPRSDPKISCGAAHRCLGCVGPDLRRPG